MSNTVGARPEYRVKNIAMLLEDVDDLTIDGTGATLLMHGQQTIFAIIRARRSTVQGFSIDWVCPRTIDLTVIEAGRDHHDLRVPDGYRYEIDGTEISWASDLSPYTGEPYWAYSRARIPTDPRPTVGDDYYLQMTDLRTGRAHRASWMLDHDPLCAGLDAVTEVSPGVLRFSYGPQGRPSEVGRVFQLRSQPRDTPGGFLWESDDSTVRDLDIGYLHGFGIIAQMTNGVTISGLNFRAPSGSWRTTAGFADLIQISGDKGQVLIEGNHFGFSHDDPINVHGTYVQLVAKDGAVGTFSYMQFDATGFPQFYVGDQVVLVDRATMLDLPGWVGTVVAVDGPSGRDRNHDLDTMTVTFDRELPVEAVVGQVVAENLTYTPSVAVRGNHFESVATRGVLMTTRKPVLIENNVFDQMEMASIYVSADWDYWYESGVVRDLTIRGNVFVRPGNDRDQPDPVIWVEPMAGGDDPAKAAREGIVIEDNVFLVGDVTVLDAKSVRGLVFRRNTVARYAASGEPAGRPGMVLRGCTGVEIADNRYGAGVGREIVTHHMRAEDTSLGIDHDLPDTGVAALASARFDGIDMPPLGAGDGVVVRAPAGLGKYRAWLDPVGDARLDVRLNGRPLAGQPDGSFVVTVGSGITVLECWVGAADGVARRVYRWTTLTR